MTDKLPEAPQDFFDQNRERFNGEMSALDLKQLQESRCAHNAVKRISYSQVECQGCHMGWIDNNHFIIESNRISGVK